jgi:tRNA1Val (adenine37-N6)-methyltransferase
VSGIVRLARRPAGWVAPGPPPARLDLRPGPGEDLCYLAGDWRILQRLDGHRWSLDDLVTAWFAAREVEATPTARFADLGCGIGTVLMLLAWRFPAACGVGVEAQEVSVDLARRSLVVNGAEGRCEVRQGDLRDSSSCPEGAVFDLVTGTPPYLSPGTATESARVQRGPCTIERRGGIEEYCVAAARLLAPGGRFVVCEAAAQTARVAAAAEGAGLGTVQRLDVIPRAGKAALFSVYAMRAAPADRIVVEPPLVVRDARGRRTEAFVAVRRAMGMPP